MRTMRDPRNEEGSQREGIRARKRRQTRQRIIEAGLRLFVSQGFEATTLDAIAEAADISRRTYFSYFASKDDLLLAWQEDAIDDLRAALVEAAPGRTPLEAARAALPAVIGRYETEDFNALDDLMRSTEILRGRKQASYERQERALFDALREVWPAEDRQPSLRITAMVAIGALRLAFESWREDGRVRPMSQYLDDAFEALKAEV